MYVLVATLVIAPLLTRAQQPADNRNVPRLPFEVVTDFLKYPPTMNLGEVLSVAVNAKGDVVVLNHPGTATTGLWGANSGPRGRISGLRLTSGML